MSKNLGLGEITEREPKISVKIELKNYLNKIVRSPLTIIGLVAVMVPIIVSIFPQLLTVYSFEEATGIYMGAWSPPSPDHPLGQTRFGRDVLALVVYGARDSLIFGFGTVFIALIGGLIFGLLAHRLNHKFLKGITSVKLIVYILIGIILAMFLANIFGNTFELLMFTTGFLLIPSFTRIVANAEFRFFHVGKEIISYVPLFAGIAILFYMILGFFRFSDPLTIQLGQLLFDARPFMFNAFWAMFWPGFVAFLILIGLFVLHRGLVKLSR